MSTSKKLPLEERQTVLLKVAADLMLLGGTLNKPSIKQDTKKELNKIRLKNIKEHPGRFNDENGNSNRAYEVYMQKARENPERLPVSVIELSQEIFQFAKTPPESFKQPDLQKILAAGLFASIFMARTDDNILKPITECANDICRNVENLVRGEYISEHTKGTTWFNRQGGKAVNVNQTLEASSKILVTLAPEGAEQFQKARIQMHKAFDTRLEQSGKKITPELQPPSETELKTRGSKAGTLQQEQMKLDGDASQSL